MDNSINSNSTIKNKSNNEDYIFDRTYIKNIFIIIYSCVFCLCVFGNILVILIIFLNQRLRSITNIFLANLAVADFCVGIFCVFQNLSIYLINEWVLGELLCKIYQFMNTLSYTASIFVLVVISAERYFAIIYPISCRQIWTTKKVQCISTLVWILSASCSAPKFYWYNTVTHTVGEKNETMCVPNRKKYNSELFDMIYCLVLYVIPVIIMTVLYTKIALHLIKTTTEMGKNINSFNKSRGPKKFVTPMEKNRSLKMNTVRDQINSHKALKSRKGVIKMLVIIVLTFAICNFPLHARKMWQYWSPRYEGFSNFSAILTPITFLLTYVNSGINPIIYAFLSKNFRRGIKEFFLCIFNKHSHQNSRMKYGKGSTSTRSTTVRCSTSL